VLPLNKTQNDRVSDCAENLVKTYVFLNFLPTSNSVLLIKSMTRPVKTPGSSRQKTLKNSIVESKKSRKRAKKSQFFSKCRLFGPAFFETLWVVNTGPLLFVPFFLWCVFCCFFAVFLAFCSLLFCCFFGFLFFTFLLFFGFLQFCDLDQPFVQDCEHFPMILARECFVWLSLWKA
jgi:hypothetical protein